MGLAVAVILVMTGWLSLFREAPALWLEGGATVLLTDAAIRLVGGVLFGAWAYVPYALSIAAMPATRYRVIFAGLAALLFVAHAALTIQTLFFVTHSTSALSVIFVPLYLTIPVLAVWGIARVSGRDTKSRSSQ